MHTTSLYVRQVSHATKQAQSDDQARSSRSEVLIGNWWTNDQLLQVYMLIMSLHSFLYNIRESEK